MIPQSDWQPKLKNPLSAVAVAYLKKNAKMARRQYQTTYYVLYI